jgi:hypothetical protein
MTHSELTATYRKSNDIVAREIEGELIIIPIVAGIGNMENELFALDEIGREIWNRIDGKRSVGEIINDLCVLYDAGRKTIEKDVLGFIKEIASRNIITVAHG